MVIRMARYQKDLVLNKPDDFVQFMMNDYIKKNQFIMSTWKKKEEAYRAGDAMLEGFKYLKWSYNNGVLHIEAWLKGSFGSEMGLDGTVGFLMKKPYKDSLEQLYTLLQQDISTNQLDEFGQPVSVVQVQTVDNAKPAKVALILGILSIVFSVLIPVVSIILAAIGFSRARLASGSSKAKQAKIASVLCIIGVVLAIAMWIIAAALNVALL